MEKILNTQSLKNNPDRTLQQTPFKQTTEPQNKTSLWFVVGLITFGFIALLFILILIIQTRNKNRRLKSL